MMEKTPDQMTPEEALKYYQEAYQKEKKKTAKLSARLADANMQVEDLTGKLNRIKDSGIWKASKPLRSAYHFMKRTSQRVGNYGSPKGIARKIRNKMIEREARTQHGLASFPSPEQRKI